MDVLQWVAFCLPRNSFGYTLLEYLSLFGTLDRDILQFYKTEDDFFPQVNLTLTGMAHPEVRFATTVNSQRISLTNQTGETKTSLETYKPITLDDYQKRARDFAPLVLDHVGCNLPWFNGVHPDILKLRTSLPKVTAYYRFPTGENWDFILPASKEEIRTGSIDLTRERRPKVEIVSFGKSSTPILQIDFINNETFETLKEIFPEALADEKLRNIWVYIENPYGIDICFVINEYKVDDWSSFFEGHQLHS
jgi:hypothetical protein